ncbi:MAG: hypothetical protein GWP91_01335 [Rhodobacterales bacterium]|nr:hypothetical protein [Rhodobacterales bacterium]
MRLPHADEIAALRSDLDRFANAPRHLQRLEGVLQAERILDGHKLTIEASAHPGPAFLIEIGQEWPTLNDIPAHPILTALLAAREVLRGLSANHAALHESLNKLIHAQNRALLEPKNSAAREQLLARHQERRLAIASITPIATQIQRMAPLSNILPLQLQKIEYELDNPKPNGVPAARAHSRLFTLTATISKLLKGTGLEHHLPEVAPAPRRAVKCPNLAPLRSALDALQHVSAKLTDATGALQDEHDTIQRQVEQIDHSIRGITG